MKFFFRTFFLMNLALHILNTSRYKSWFWKVKFKNFGNNVYHKTTDLKLFHFVLKIMSPISALIAPWNSPILSWLFVCVTVILCLQNFQFFGCTGLLFVDFRVKVLPLKKRYKWWHQVNELAMRCHFTVILGGLKTSPLQFSWIVSLCEQVDHPVRTM